MMRKLRLMRVVLALVGVACGASDNGPRAIDGLELSDGRTIRLGEPDIEAHDTPDAWRRDNRQKVSVATADGLVVAIVALRGAADFPIEGYGFGADFDDLREGVKGFRPVTVADRPGLVLDGRTSLVYALPVADPETCEFRPEVAEVAVVSPGYEAMLTAHLEGQPPCQPPPPPIIVLSRDVGGNMEIFVRDNRTGKETRLTDNPAEDSAPMVVYRSVHRGGSRIVFQSNRDGNFQIYVMDADGSRLRRLISSSADDTSPDWSPDERSVVFVSNRDGNREIYSVGVDGSNLRRLTDSAAIEAEPTWASNVRLQGGTDIAYSSNLSGNYEIYVMRSDGSGARMLTDNTSRDYRPAWSPDGSRIAYVSERDGNREIYVMNADGSEQTRLTDSPASDYAPLWSVDGKRIRFFTDRDGSRATYSMNADGSGQVRTDP